MAAAQYSSAHSLSADFRAASCIVAQATRLPASHVHLCNLADALGGILSQRKRDVAGDEMGLRQAKLADALFGLFRIFDNIVPNSIGRRSVART
jgi:hypothetical protein